VLILREVLGFSAREVAQSLETTVAAVNSSLQRARKAVDERLPARSQQETLRDLGDDEARRIVEAYLDAWNRRDFGKLRALLAEDAVFSMPPWPIWWRGRETIAAFGENAVDECAVHLTVPTQANGQPAIAYYQLDEDTGRYVPAAIDVYALDGGLISQITGFVAPELFPQFGLPAELACAVRS
jgi:RNA polymerase sigma-70 factor, ECF subfamily